MKQDLVFKYFTEICQIPHTSGNEGAIREYLLDVLQKNGVETYVDPIGNVYGKKHGNIKTSILYQAHMDMVGAKTTDSTHDFLKDPIKYQCIDNKIIKAEKTTLGADNGIGVAMILAMVCDDLTKDFDFEILLTVEEETTTIGAANIQENYFTSKYLINLDSEEEDTITIGSASSCKVVIDIPITRKDLNQKKYLFKIFDGISGHSGATIHEKRANCIVEIFNILKELLKKYKINLVTAKAGEVVNAIPGSCEVIFSTNDDINAIIKDVKEIFTIFKKAYEEFEPNLNFNISEVDDYEVVDINDKSTLDVVNFIVAANNGLNTYSFEQKMTTSSTNLGILYVLENVVTLM
jgi:dipeptidase D